MPQSFAPFGLRPVAAFGTHSNGVRFYPLPNGATCPQLGTGSPVGLTGGVVVSTGAGTGPILGVCAGFAWVSDSTKRPVLQQWIPSGTSSAGFIDGENRPQAAVIDNPEAIFMVQANASVTAGDLGLNFNVTATAADAVDTVYGQSRMALHAASRTSAITGAFKVVGIARIVDNTWGDPYPVVLVRMNSVIAQVSAG